MSTVGLTKAMRRALERLWYDAANATPHMRKTLCDLGLIRIWPGDVLDTITPRGHAALAAPRMTQAEYSALSWIENNGPTKLEYVLNWRLEERGFLSVSLFDCRPTFFITPAGRTALNNARAAMPGEWKELS